MVQNRTLWALWKILEGYKNVRTFMEQRCLFFQGNKSFVTCETGNADIDDNFEFSNF